MEKQSNMTVKRFKIDNDLEFCSEFFNNFCKHNDLVRYQIVVKTLQHNGLVNRFNRNIVERMRCMLLSVRVPKWCFKLNQVQLLLT